LSVEQVFDRCVAFELDWLRPVLAIEP